MKAKMLLFQAGMIVVLLAHFVFQVEGLQAQSVQTVTTTLLPLPEQGDKVGNQLWIYNNKPPKEIVLQFDLSALPAGLGPSNIKLCFLRLVASQVVYKPDANSGGGSMVIVTGRKEGGDGTNIVSLTFSTAAAVVSQDSDALRNAVYDQYKAGKPISLRLSTISDKASSLFYSSEGFGDSPSNIPRLVIEYTPPAPSLLETMSWPQHQQNPEHTGRNAWKPFQGPDKGFTVEKIELPKINNQNGKVVDYPLIYQGKMYLVEEVSGANYLLALDYYGKRLTHFEGMPVSQGIAILQKDIDQGKVLCSPAISRNGIVYIVTEKKISAYDLRQDGKKVASYPEKGDLPGTLGAYTDLTIGNDGSVFLALNENYSNYIYGFTPNLKPMLKSGALPKGNIPGIPQGNISTITVSPDGTEIFAETPCPEKLAPAKGCIVEIDVVNPSRTTFIPLKSEDSKDQPQDYYNTPVAGATEQDRSIMIMSDIAKNASKGNVWAWKVSPRREFERIWNASSLKSSVSRPVLGSNGTVYYIQDSQLQGHAIGEVGGADTKISNNNSGLKTSSNLVMDGGDNIYFWDTGKLRGCRPDGSALFVITKVLSGEVVPKAPDGPEQFIRLMASPDGTLWANNNNALFLWAFKPQYAQTDLTLTPDNLQPTKRDLEICAVGTSTCVPRVYRANGKLTVGDGVTGVTLKAGTNTLFQAQDSIAFGRGFTVEKGASLLCRTGF